jgi:hypothetical protein
MTTPAPVLCSKERQRIGPGQRPEVGGLVGGAKAVTIPRNPEHLESAKVSLSLTVVRGRSSSELRFDGFLGTSQPLALATAETNGPLCVVRRSYQGSMIPSLRGHFTPREGAGRLPALLLDHG